MSAARLAGATLALTTLCACTARYGLVRWEDIDPPGQASNAAPASRGDAPPTAAPAPPAPTTTTATAAATTAATTTATTAPMTAAATTAATTTATTATTAPATTATTAPATPTPASPTTTPAAPAPAPTAARDGNGGNDDKGAASVPPPKPAAAPEPIATAPVDADGTILVEGMSVDDGELVDVPALDLACMAAPDALTTPQRARARFDETARKLGVTASSFSFVVLERDPARSVTDPPPHLCRTIASDPDTMKAPLLHMHEPAARWRIKRITANLVDDAAALVRSTKDGVGPPRVILDDSGALIAVALPVARARGGS